MYFFAHLPQVGDAEPNNFLHTCLNLRQRSGSAGDVLMGENDMNTLELGKYWLSRLCHTLPDSSTRMRTRMAWRLAALSVATDQALAELSDADLTKFGGGSAALLDIRDQYVKLRC
jgi:hypothetical protein